MTDKEPIQIIVGDCIDVLRTMQDRSVHCCVTSPPYWGLRDYGVEGQIGLEETPEAYVARLVEVFREVRRVLRDDGTCWVNLGDSYANDTKWGGTTGGKHVTALHGENVGRGKRNTGLKAKDLVGIPWRVAFALQADGWYLRQDIIWAKPNPMPESVTDRCTKSHEYIFLLSKSARYFYDAEAIKESAGGWNGSKFDDARDLEIRPNTGRGPRFGGNKFPDAGSDGPYSGNVYHPSGTRNKRSVWTVPSAPFKEAHFATFPPRLIEPCILAGVPKMACSACGAPWVRVVEKGAPDMVHRKACGADATGGYNGTATKDYASGGAQNASATKARILAGMVERKTVGFRHTCECNADTIPGTVLDPFGGAGTTGLVAKRMMRRAILIELNPEYATMARKRIEFNGEHIETEEPDTITPDLFG